MKSGDRGVVVFAAEGFVGLIELGITLVLGEEEAADKKKSIQNRQSMTRS